MSTAMSSAHEPSSSQSSGYAEPTWSTCGAFGLTSTWKNPGVGLYPDPSSTRSSLIDSVCTARREHLHVVATPSVHCGWHYGDIRASTGFVRGRELEDGLQGSTCSSPPTPD